MALAQWFKFDFHTHTPESRCFPDKSVTADLWLESAKNSGLNGVVICDHNSVGFINKIDTVKEKYENNSFKVFYGIELCVSADFTHFIIIFDDKMTVTDIEDAVISGLGLKRCDWSNTEINVSEDKLKEFYNEYKDRIFIIPAHFASNKGLGECNINAIRKYMDCCKFSAIEVRNEEDVREYDNKCNLKVINKAVCISGSDNPSDKDESQHSIEGFGKLFTWVKMSTLSFEGLKQVFIDPEHRCIDWVKLQQIGVEFNPNEVPYNYIAGAKLSGFNHLDEIDMRFSPNLNCIVGGRGAGKSTIVDALDYGVGDKTDISKCELMDKTFNGSIETFFNFGVDKPYLIKTTRNRNRIEQIIRDEDGVVENPPEFKVDFYGQKEIYSLIEDDNRINDGGDSPLVKMIDEKIPTGLYPYKDNIENKILELQHLSDEYRSNKKRIGELPTVKAEIEKADAILKKLKASGLEKAREEYEQIDKSINNVISYINSTRNSFEVDKEKYQVRIDEVEYEIASLANSKNINTANIEALSVLKECLVDTVSSIEKRVVAVDKIMDNYQSSDVFSRKADLQHKYQEALSELKNTGGENIEEIQNQLQANKTREQELEMIIQKQISIEKNIDKKIEEFVASRVELSRRRMKVISDLELDGIEIEIKPLGHIARWKQNLQNELGKSGSFDKEFDELSQIILNDENDYEAYKSFLRFLLMDDNGDISVIYPECNGRFSRIWLSKQDNNTLSSLIRVIPEDKVLIKIVESTGTIDINDGSPGQKSAAILAFILNSGTNPLIIDQPEDDLDNSLIYNLIVKSIRKMKNKRQIIIVTHNPNIPVLGDAEGIIILERDKNGKVSYRMNKKAGCIEEKTIRDGICCIMEGGEDAFRKREQKYQYRN